MENWRRFLKEEVEGKPKLIFLIGPPAVGKTRWVKENPQIVGDYVILSNDDMVEKAALEAGIGTYDDMFKRTPAEILPLPAPGLEDLQKIEPYLASLQAVADKFNKENPEEVEKFGPVAPFDVDDYITALTPYTEKHKGKGGWGVSMTVVDRKTGKEKQNFIPLYYPKIKTAKEAAKEEFEGARTRMATGKKNVIIDMVNISLRSRDGHRVHMAAAIEGEDKIPSENVVGIINNNFVQEAYVFANSTEGWTDEEEEKIKEIALLRAGEYKEEGRSKTIPASAYDRMFGQYSPPTEAEGYSTIKYVGIPSLAKLTQKEEVV